MTRDLKVPLYIHISELIRGMARTLGEGDKLPSEHVLIERFGCSRSTVRKAIDELVSKGEIIRKQGIGNLVSKPRLHYFHQEYISFTEQVEARGLQATTSVKSISTTKDQSILTKFESDKSFALITELVVIERYRFVDHQLAIVEYTYLPSSYKDAVDVVSIEANGLYRTLAKKGLIENFSAEEKLTPVNIPESLISQFGTTKCSPLMQIERISKSSLGMFEYTKSLINTDFFSFYRSIRTA